MKSWRLNWTLNELFSTDNYVKHKEALESKSIFWLTLAVKFSLKYGRSPYYYVLKKAGHFM